MEQFVSALVGFFSGMIIGAVILVLILCYVVIAGTDFDAPSVISDFVDWLRTFQESHPSYFTVAFFFGFFTGFGWSGLSLLPRFGK